MAELQMSHEMTADLQSRILSLKAELDALSLRLQSPAPDTTASPAQVVQEEPATPATHHGDSSSSVRTLRDLLWQGRWSLAFHLAKALEAQDVCPDFSSSTIRAWTLAVTAERRSSHEASALIQELCRPASNVETLADRMLKWAALIGLLRAVDPVEVRACASLFVPPEELAATAGWWDEYVSALASAGRPAAHWLSLPENEPVTAEINQLMIVSVIEPVRLAASCLMMSVKAAMRRVHVASAADARFVLNSELARGTSVMFDENGEVTTPAIDVERAVCDLAASTSNPKPLFAEASLSASEKRPLPESLTEAPTPRAQLALERLEAAEQSLQSVVNGQATENAATTDRTVQDERRVAARERLRRYSERLASRSISRETIPIRPMRVEPVGGEMAVVAVAESAGHTSSAMQQGLMSSRPISTTAIKSLADMPTDRRPDLSSDERRGIHEHAVASAFADGGRVSKGAAPTSVRPYNDGSIWNALLTPQAAIVAGLVVIASAILAGLGNGLSASSITTNAAATSTPSPAEHSTADAGDFDVVQ
ncbi:MAG TPA: hypothetical protein VM510_16655 [Caulifigura sp.]|nr:hypothetical protein [Caulifigura sp.]